MLQYYGNIFEATTEVVIVNRIELNLQGHMYENCIIKKIIANISQCHYTLEANSYVVFHLLAHIIALEFR